jgi:hypothetical protein
MIYGAGTQGGTRDNAALAQMLWKAWTNGGGTPDDGGVSTQSVPGNLNDLFGQDPADYSKNFDPDRAKLPPDNPAPTPGAALNSQSTNISPPNFPGPIGPLSKANVAPGGQHVNDMTQGSSGNNAGCLGGLMGGGGGGGAAAALA